VLFLEKKRHKYFPKSKKKYAKSVWKKTKSVPRTYGRRRSFVPFQCAMQKKNSVLEKNYTKRDIALLCFVLLQK